MSIRVALVVERVEHWRGGAETSTQQFIRHLLAAGVRIDLFTRSEWPETPGLDLHNVAVSSVPRAFQLTTFAKRVDALLHGHRRDLVHALTPCLSADIYQPRGGTIPEIIERNVAIRHTPAARWFKRFAEHANLKKRGVGQLERALVTRTPPPLAIALSDYVADQLKRHYDLADGQIRKIFNGVDYAALSAQQCEETRRRIRSQYGLNDGHVLALLVAHNFKLKGVLPWLRALAELIQSGHREFRSLVVGKGNAAAYQGPVRSWGLSEAMTFVGPTEHITDFYCAADVLIHPTYYDPCSRVVLEGLLHGLPCVTTRYNGAAEAVDDGATGRIIEEPDDIAALAQATVQVAQPPYRQVLAEQHHRLVDALSMKRHASQVIELYESLLD